MMSAYLNALREEGTKDDCLRQIEMWMEKVLELETKMAGAEPVTLRDYFAGQALAGLCANSGGPFQANGLTGWGIVNCKEPDIALQAYVMADAMLQARSKSDD